MQLPSFDIFGRPGWPKPPPEQPLVMRVSVWDGADWLGRSIRGVVKLDNAVDEPPRPLVYGEIEDGRLRFTFPPDVMPGWHARLTIVVNGRTESFDITLADDVDVTMSGAVVIPGTTSRVGYVQVDRKVIFDNAGKFTGRGATWFWFFQSLLAGDDRVLRELDWWMDPRRKPDFFRVLCEVGTSGKPDSSWTGIEIDWTMPKWKAKGQETIARGLDLCKERGIRLELTILGKGSNTDPLWLSDLVADVVVDSRQDAVQDIEMVNESGSGTKVSIEVMKKMAAIFKKKVPNILALSSPMEGGEKWQEMEDAALALGLKGFSVHQRRSMGDRGWAYVRQGFDAKDTKLATFYNEMKGHADSSGGLTDVLLLATAAAVAKMCGAATIVAHNGTGVYGDGKAHDVGGKRPASWSEIEPSYPGGPDYTAQLEAQWRVLDLVPVGVQNWSVRNTQNAGVPLDLPKSMHQGGGYEGSSGFGVNKAYAAVSPDGREFVQIPCGVKMAGDKPCPMDVMAPWQDVTVYDIATREPVKGLENISISKGDKLPIPARSDGMTASIVRGKKA